MVIEAIVVASVIGVALGLLTYRTDRPRELVLAVAGVFLTIPSIALFGLFIRAPDPFGLSRTSVVTALVMYSLLPIVRNTIVGLREVDPAVVESAEGMGMGRFARLVRIELPLAWPVIDMYWEYTGTGWSSHLGREISEAPDSPEALADAVAEADKSENNVIWYDTAAMNNTYALVTLSSRAEDLGVTTISDYADLVQSDPEAASLCGATEWLTRDDGYPGLADAYGFDVQDQLTEFADISPIAALVAAGDECNFGEAFATNGDIIANDLVVLEDDMNYFVPYNVALTVDGDVDGEYGEELAAIFDPITAMLTNETMQALNAKVDVDGEDPAAVAEQFLTENGLIGPM